MVRSALRQGAGYVVRGAGGAGQNPVGVVTVQPGCVVVVAVAGRRVRRPIAMRLRAGAGAGRRRIGQSGAVGDECRRAGCICAARGAAGDVRAGRTDGDGQVFLPTRIGGFSVGLRPSLMRFGVRAVALATAVADGIGMA